MVQVNLLEKTRAYATREVLTDNKATPGDAAVFEVVATGLTVKLSEVLKGAPADGRGCTMTVYADTLVIDRTQLDVDGAVLVARVIDVSALAGKPLLVRVPPARHVTPIEIIAQEARGGPFALQPNKEPPAPWTPPLGFAPKLQKGLLVVESNGTGKTSTSTEASALAGALSSSWGLSSLRASATAATYLAWSTDSLDLAVSRSLLGWVVSWVKAISEGRGTGAVE
jgi:hypothetical protein